MSRTGWQFYDPQTDVTYILPVNPHTDSGSNSITKTIGYSALVGSHQNTLGEHEISPVIYSTGRDLERFSYSGNIYNEEQLNAFELWFSKGYPLEVIDDLGRHYEVLLENFTISRVRSNMNRWKHSYQFNMLVLQRFN